MTVIENRMLERQARDHLVTLGLAFRLPEGTFLAEDTWLEIHHLAQKVVDAVSFQEPDIKGPWLRIDRLPTPPNEGGWFTYKAAPSPYWITKTDLVMLQELEHRLDALAPPQPVHA